MPDPTMHGWTLRGRDDALAAVTDALAHGVVLLDASGPEGVGRTRFAAEVAARARAGEAEVERLTAVASAGALALAPLLPAPGGAPTEVARAILSALASRAVPPVIVLDDAHLLDPVSADVLLLALTRGLARLVLTRRTDAPLPAGIVRLLDLDGAELALQPLADAPMTVLLGQALGHVDPISTRRLLERSEGRPAWLRVLLRSGLRSGALRASSQVWSWRSPEGSQAAVPLPATALAGSLAHLQPAARRVIDLVALAGELTPSELAGVADGDALEEAFASGTVSLRVSRRRRAVRLTHPLDADRLLGALTPAARLALGRTLLDCCAGSPGRRGDDAARPVLPALATGAPVPVPLLLEAARALRPRDPSGMEPLARAALAGALADGDRAEARWLLADALEKTGRHAEAVTVLAEGHPPRDEADAAFHTVQVVSNALWSGDAAAEQRAHDELVGADLDSPGGDELIAMACWLHAFPGGAAEAVALARALLADPRCGDRARVWATTALVLALGALGRSDEVPAVLAPARAAAARLPGEPYADDQLGWVEVFAEVMAGRVHSGLAIADDGYAQALRGEDSVRVGAWASMRAVAAGSAGQLTLATVNLRETQALLDPAGTGGAYGAGALATSHLGMLQAQQGRADAARETVAAVQQSGVLAGPGVALLRTWVVRDAAWAGLAGTRELLETVRGCAATLPAIALSGAVDALRLGAVREALPLLRELAPRVAGPAGQGWELVVAALSRPGAQGMEAAVDVLALAGATLVGAELLELAATKRSPVDAARVRLRRDALLDTLEPVQTPLLRAHGTGLTTREQEIAALAAQGLPSRRIAQDLVLSVRTVDNHLGRIYLKLGVNDRRGLLEVLGGARDS